MRKRTRAAWVGVSACGLLLPFAAAPASAQEGPPLPAGVSVVAGDLALPLQVGVGANGTIYVSEAAAGQVTQIDRQGRRSVLASGLGDFAPGLGTQGSWVWVTTSTSGEPTSDDEDAPPPPQIGADLHKITASGAVVRTVDLFEYELEENPDGQQQYDDDGNELDALTNPYDVLALPGRRLIADAGANVINEVRANGDIRTLTVLPVSTAGACATLPNNTPSGFGCDPVPTGIALGPDGYVYVSGLGAEVEGHIWKIHARTGEIVQSWDGLLPLTGIAVGPDGAIYVSAIDFDTEDGDGRVLRINPANGQVTGSVALPVPTGMAFDRGRLLVTSGFTGLLLSVQPRAFTAP